MNDLLNLTFENKPVRIILRDGSPWFAATDVAEILGYSHAPHMVRALDDDEKGVHNVDTLGGNQDMTIISESGLYNAIFKSRRTEAKAFRRWVTATVLPEIRRTGRFNVHSGALDGPLAALPALLDATTAVTLPELCRRLSIVVDPDALAMMAGVLRARGWRKAWVRAEALDHRLRIAPADVAAFLQFDAGETA
jgi:prophage antirepressor-like protein